MTTRLAAFASLIFLLAAIHSGVHADTIDARQLAEMREPSAESLATRIRTLQMTYVQDYELDRQPENPTLGAVAEIQKKFEDRLAAATDPKQRERLLTRCFNTSPAIAQRFSS